MKCIQSILVLLLIATSCKNSVKKTTDNKEVYISYENPDVREAYTRNMLNQGLDYVHEGEYAKAKFFIMKADSAFPNSPNITTTLGNVIGQLEGFESSLPYHRRAIKEDSNYINAYINYSTTLNHMKQCREAVEILRLALKRKTITPLEKQHVDYTLACSFNCMGEINKALSILDSAMLLGRYNDQLYKNVTDFKEELKNVSEHKNNLKASR